MYDDDYYGDYDETAPQVKMSWHDNEIVLCHVRCENVMRCDAALRLGRPGRHHQVGVRSGGQPARAVQSEGEVYQHDFD